MSFQDKGIMAIGHVLADAFGKGGEAFIERFGRQSSPSHISAEQMEGFFATLSKGPDLLAEPLTWKAGGGIVNMARVALALGIKTELWGSVGRDERGRSLREEMVRAGAVTRFIESPSPTGVFCAIVLEGNDKSITVSPSAARDIRGADIQIDALHDGWILYVDGLLIDELPWLGLLAEKALSRNMRIALDLSTPANAKHHARELYGFAEAYCEVVFANEAEFEAMSIAHFDFADSRPIWVVKKGGQGASSYSRGKKLHADTTRIDAAFDIGAGDAFSAGFLLGFMEGLGREACLRMGNAVASAALKHQGQPSNALAIRKAYEDERHSVILSKTI